MKKVTSGVDH